MQDWNVDPKTGDYVMVNGAPQETDSLLPPAYRRLKTKRGKWLYAPDSKYGSNLYTIKKLGNAISSGLIDTTVVDALLPMITDGRAKTVDSQTNGTTNRSASSSDITIFDQQGNPEVIPFNPIGP
jgi:phage gp46-like protein